MFHFFSGNQNKKLWTPAKLVTEQWIDLNDTGTITLNGSNISQINDNSGNSRHISQSTGSAQPPYSATAFNGKPAINITTSTGRIYLMSPAAFNITDMFVAIQYEDGVASVWSAGYQAFIGGQSTQVLYAGPAGTNTWTSAHFSTGRLNGGDPYTLNNSVALPLPYSTFHIFNATAKNYQWLYGCQATNQTNRNWTGVASEIICLNGAPSTADRQKIEGYLAHKWGMTASLASDHPYKNKPPYV
jgi:hypothetical protein